MENGNDKLGAHDIFAALQQKKITAEEFAADLSVVLNDFFIGTVKAEKKRLTMTLMNGQKFNISVTEK